MREFVIVQPVVRSMVLRIRFSNSTRMYVLKLVHLPCQIKMFANLLHLNLHSLSFVYFSLDLEELISLHSLTLPEMCREVEHAWHASFVYRSKLSTQNSFESIGHEC